MTIKQFSHSSQSLLMQQKNPINAMEDKNDCWSIYKSG